MKIITNNHWNNLLYGYDLPKSVLSDFDYLDDIDSSSFFKYKGHYYDIGEFIKISATIAPHPQRPGWENWHGYSSDSYFSGVLLKLSDDGKQYKVGTYIT